MSAKVPVRAWWCEAEQTSFDASVGPPDPRDCSEAHGPLVEAAAFERALRESIAADVRRLNTDETGAILLAAEKFARDVERGEIGKVEVG